MVEHEGGAIAEHEFHALLLLLGAIDVLTRGGDISLVAVPDGERHADFGEFFPAGRSVDSRELLTAVHSAGPQLKVGNRLGLGAAEHGLRTGSGNRGDADSRTLFGDRFDNLLFIELRKLGFQVSFDGLERHFRFSDNGREGAPFLAESAFLHSGADLHASGFNLGLQDFRFVGLPGIHQPPFGFRVVLGNARQIAFGLQHLLRREHAVKSDANGAFNADLLLFRFDLRKPDFLAENLAVLGELSRGDNGLGDEESLFSAAHRSAADFVSGVAYGGIRVEAGLLLPCLRGAKFRFRLPQRGIALCRRLLQRGETHQRTFGLLLCFPHARKFRFHGSRVHRVAGVLLHSGHALHLVFLCWFLCGLLGLVSLLLL